jgi:hypothetical protein
MEITLMTEMSDFRIQQTRRRFLLPNKTTATFGRMAKQADEASQ